MKAKGKNFLDSSVKQLNKAKHVGVNTVANLAKSTIGATQSFVKVTQDSLSELQRKSADKKITAERKKYYPIFLEQFQHDDYNLPSLVMIVDDAISKHQQDIKNGAIGYRSTVKDIEVLYLYDEKVSLTGLNFNPVPSLDTLFYVDPFNRNRFIQLDLFLDKMQESRLAELQHIAYSLGAKRYKVEIIENKDYTQSKTKKLNAEVRKKSQVVESETEHETDNQSNMSKQIVASAEFSGQMRPVFPNLNWFAQDDNIINLVNMRCVADGYNLVKQYNFVFKGNKYSSMSQKTASKIDAAVGLVGIKLGFDIKGKVIDEHNHSLLFQIEFE